MFLYAPALKRQDTKQTTRTQKKSNIHCKHVADRVKDLDGLMLVQKSRALKIRGGKAQTEESQWKRGYNASSEVNESQW